MVVGHDDTVWFDVLDSFPSKLKSCRFCLSWFAFSNHLPVSWTFFNNVLVLNEKSTDNTSVFCFCFAGILSVKWQLKDTQVFLLGSQDFKCFICIAWCNDDFKEDTVHFLSCRSVNFTVEDYNTTKDWYWVSFISVVPSCFNVISLTDTTWVHMFESHDCWTVFEITDDTDSGISVTDIVEWQFFTVKLFSWSNGVSRWQTFLVEVCVLLRVFTITHWLLEVISQSEFFRFCFTHLSCEVFCNQSVVWSCVTVYFCCQTLASFVSCFTVCWQFVKNNSIVSRIYNNCYASVVFSRWTKHWWPTDIDVFNCVSIGHVWFENSLLEWVKVYHNKVDKFDIIVLSRLKVAMKVTTSEETTVDIWMKSLHTTVHHFWETSYIINGNGVNTSIVKGNFGTTCWDDIPTKFFEFLGKFNNARFIWDTN